MPRKKNNTKDPNKPTGAEMEILGLLWEHGPSTVREIHSASGSETGYTSTLKILQNMADKGFVLRDESNRSHVYRARDEADDMQRSLVRDLLKKAFGGRPQKLVMHAISEENVSPEEIAEIRNLLNQMEKKQTKRTTPKQK